MAISGVLTLSETTSGLGQNPKVTVIPLLSRLFQQVVNPLLKRNYIVYYFFFLSLLRIIFTFAFTRT